VLAAAGLVALAESPGLLAEDHANARRLAEGLAGLAGVSVDPEKVATNIVIFDVGGAGLTTAEFAAGLKARGVLANGINARELRMVTHYDVSRADVETALRAAQLTVKG
jgi:threonine aldolase